LLREVCSPPSTKFVEGGENLIQKIVNKIYVQPCSQNIKNNFCPQNRSNPHFYNFLTPSFPPQIVELANTQLPSARLESLSKHSLRDYLMVSLLANLAKTQLSIQEKLVTG